ncbi:MAG: hypothetical protein KatS3mg005_0817 [Bryobacteraceae bacterium]|nr:MAG: hypothetical protein KatS3mg005_0817 [Bryobacteraceae bacterium]
MPLTTVFVRGPGGVVSRRSRRLEVRLEGCDPVEIPVRETAAVVLVGPVQVTAQALALLFRRGVPVAFLWRQGWLRGRLAPALSRQAGVRLAQDRAASDGQECLLLARPPPPRECIGHPFHGPPPGSRADGWKQGGGPHPPGAPSGDCSLPEPLPINRAWGCGRSGGALPEQRSGPQILEFQFLK